MKLLGDAGCLFVGQGVACDGVATFDSLSEVPMSQRIEFPVAEELNLGFATGLAMMGHLPVVVIPRMDFLLRAADQIVSHLDKIEQMSRGEWVPKVIIRTRIGGRVPLDPGPQHTGNYVRAFRSMLKTVVVEEICSEESILPVYQFALEYPRSLIVVENLG